MARLRGAFPDARTTLEDIVAEGDRVAFGIVRIAEGKIAEEWGGLDQADLFRPLAVSAIRD